MELYSKEYYANFSWEAIQKSWQDICKEAKEKTGATDEQMGLAIAEVAGKFMDTNFMKEEKR